MQNVKAIFFDAGGTLFRPYPSVGEVYARTASRHGVKVEAAAVEKAFHDQWHQRNGLASLTAETSERIERDWWYALVRDVFGNLADFPDFDSFFKELYDLFARAECWRLFDDTIPVLQKLKSAGYRLGVISNWDHRLFSIVEQLALSGYFEVVVASAAAGVAKPGAGIFRKALEGMAVEPSHSLHVGDSLTDDYHGAKAAGMHAVLLDRAHPLSSGSGPAPRRLRGRHRKAYNGVVRIESLHQLPDLLS